MNCRSTYHAIFTAGSMELAEGIYCLIVVSRSKVVNLHLIYTELPDE
jgi:hypothetical protein